MLREAAERCADAWESEPELAKRTAGACVSYLWRVHGVDYFAGTELAVHEYRSRLSRTPTAPPADAGKEAAWEGAVDTAWQRRIAEGDNTAQLLAPAAVESAAEAFVTSNIRSSSDGKKCAAVHVLCEVATAFSRACIYRQARLHALLQGVCRFCVCAQAHHRQACAAAERRAL